MLILKMIISAFVVAGVNVLARVNPQLAGWIAALPVITFLSVLWLVVDHRDSHDIATFVIGVLYGLLPSGALLGVTALFLQRGTPLPLAVAFGFTVWGACTFVATRLGLFGA